MVNKWYATGMISLLGVFPLLYCKTMSVKERLNQRAMIISIPKQGNFDERLPVFSEQSVLRAVADKRQSVFYLNDFIKQKENVFEAIRIVSREIKFGYDTSRVVKVVLGNECTLNDFVSVMNI